MKIYINEPPRGGKNNSDRIDALTDWLYDVTVKLNMGFRHIGEENLSEELKKKLEIEK